MLIADRRLLCFAASINFLWSDSRTRNPGMALAPRPLQHSLAARIPANTWLRGCGGVSAGDGGVRGWRSCSRSSGGHVFVVQARRGSNDDYASRRNGSGKQPDDRNQNKKRRKGRPAWQRSPDDSPYRDGNRDRLIGLLTERAARTLAYYLSETNLNVYHWLLAFMRQYPIPKEGTWDDVSGESFLRTLLSMPIQSAKFITGREETMYDNIPGSGVDPRSIAQRIMDIRKQLAKEWASDLLGVPEENASLLRESLTSSLDKMFAGYTTSSSDDDDGGVSLPDRGQEPPKPSA